MDTDLLSGSDVTSASNSSSDAQDEYSFLDDSGNLRDEASQTSGNGSVKQDTPSTVADQSAEPVAAGESLAKDRANDLSPGVKKRIDKLTAKLKTTQESLMKQLHDAQLERDQYKEAFTLQNGKYEQKVSRLSEIDPNDPNVEKLEELQFKEQIRLKQAELEKQHSERVNQAVRQAQIDARSEQYLEEVEDAVETYPTVEKFEIALALKNDPTSSPLEIAKSIHDRRAKFYEAEFTKKYGARLTPPAPTTPTGTQTVRKTPLSDEDLIAELDAALGPDWNR